MATDDEVQRRLYSHSFTSVSHVQVFGPFFKPTHLRLDLEDPYNSLILVLFCFSLYSPINRFVHRS